MTNESPLLVSLKSVRMSYAMGAATVNAVNGVSLDVHAGEFLALSGPSGSGKTTLLNIMGAIEKPTAGSVELCGMDISMMADADLARLRRDRLGFVFQNFNLLPVLTALENVEYPLILQGVSRRERRNRAEEALRRVGLENHLVHLPSQMSGGQRQRVAIARALVGKPSLILADEPTANLDHETGEQILTLMTSLNHDDGVTFVFSTHDEKVRRRASRVVQVWDGRIAENGDS